MKKISYVAAGMVGFFMLAVPLAFANTPSISIQSISPASASVIAKDRITFIITASGFLPQSYQLTDSFTNSTVSSSNVSGAGNFFWAPLANDVGTHTLTITASDFSGNSANVTQTITVSPLPSLTIGSVSPGTTIMPGTTFSFAVSTPGLTNPSYSISDNFSGSSVSTTNLNSGNFSWTPDLSQDGDHQISIYVYDSLGHSASAIQSVHVGAGPTLNVILVSPGTSVPIGTTTSFTVTPVNFSPNAFSVTDSFSGSTISNNNINTTGQFSWMPQASDVGVHLITIKGVVGVFGQSATTTQAITVLGPNGAVPSTSIPTSAPTSISTITSTPASTPTTPLSAGFVFSMYLHPGMQSDDVMHLQTVLSQIGFFSGTATGYYGALTTNAVVQFQAAHGLSQLGVVGPATRAALNGLQRGSTSTSASTPSATGDGYVFNNFMGLGEDTTDGTDVLELQKRLTTLGFFSGASTGTFGSATEIAVKQFQTSHSIPATGYVGLQTRAALNK
jgi:peptidoglycan hydrolase-like protein with peptidoglycan-binding domain